MRNKILLAIAMAAGISGLAACGSKNASGDGNDNNSNQPKSEEVWSCSTESYANFDFDQETCRIGDIVVEDIFESSDASYTPGMADPEAITGLDSIRYKLFVDHVDEEGVGVKYHMMGSLDPDDATPLAEGYVDMKWGEPIDMSEMGTDRYNIPRKRVTLEAVTRENGGSLETPVESVGPFNVEDPYMPDCTVVQERFEVYDCVLFRMREYTAPAETQDATPKE